MRFLWLFLAALAVAGCQTASIPANLDPANLNNQGVLLISLVVEREGLEAADRPPGLYSAGLTIKNAASDDYLPRLGYDPLAFQIEQISPEIDGELFQVLVPPGPYEPQWFDFQNRSNESHTGPICCHPPIEVDAGSVTYLGEVKLLVRGRAAVFAEKRVWSITTTVSDKSERGRCFVSGETSSIRVGPD